MTQRLHHSVSPPEVRTLRLHQHLTFNVQRATRNNAANCSTLLLQVHSKLYTANGRTCVTLFLNAKGAETQRVAESLGEIYL